MSSLFTSILFIYAFISLGYLSKKIFKDDINTKTLTVLSVYFMQPFVTVWGFSTAKLHSEHFTIPLVYLGITLLLLIPTALIARGVFADKKERAIFSIAGFVGNTGNIGIPLGLAIFGEQSVIYTTLINIANVFVVYILGVYIYSRGSFGIGRSLLNIIKIPIIPASIIAILINIYNIPLSIEIREFFKMGAYGGIMIQLFLLGTFLYGLKLHEISKKLLLGALSQKFIFVPLATILILSFTDIPHFVQAIILMEMMTPLAVANINLSSLYDCRPRDVSTLIFLSTLLFIPVLFVLNYLITYLYQ
jgi:predicted permease